MNTFLNPHRLTIPAPPSRESAEPPHPNLIQEDYSKGSAMIALKLGAPRAKVHQERASGEELAGRREEQEKNPHKHILLQQIDQPETKLRIIRQMQILREPPLICKSG